jgi:hypothetical protein
MLAVMTKMTMEMVIGKPMPFSITVDMSAIPIGRDTDGEPVFKFNNNDMPVADAIDVMSTTIHGPSLVMMAVGDITIINNPDVAAALRRATAMGRTITLTPADGY